MENEIMIVDNNQLILHTIDALKNTGKEGAEAAVVIIRELLKIKQEQELWAAKKQFYTELSAFQKECPPITKNASARIVTKNGGYYEYKYATLDNIEKTVKPLLMSRGFSYRWNSEPINDNRRLRVTCYLHHGNGYEITATAEAPIPENMGSMNAVQLPSAVRTYLQRSTLIQVLGLSSADEDNDANAPDETPSKTVINENKVNTIREIIDRLPDKSVVQRMLNHFKITAIEELKESDYPIAVRGLTKHLAKTENGNESN